MKEAEHFGVRGSKAFIEAVREMVGSDRSQWCIIAVDVEHFKIFNEWYGRNEGDHLLTRIGDVLRRLESRSEAVCGYFGMDDFGVCMPYDRKAIRRLYNELRSVVASCSPVLGFRPIFGVNSFMGGTPVSMTLYDHAAIALEQKKQEKRDEIGYFDPVGFEKEAEDIRIMMDFQEAIRNNEIEFQLQPVYRISNGRIVAFEALARWEKKDGEVVSPASYIPLLEKNGFVTDLDKIIWEKVCRWLCDIINKDIEPIPVSLNVSRRDIYSMDVPSYLYALTEKYLLSPHLLKVEITESAYAEDFDLVRQVAGALKEKGFSVMMDDFGSGYSSLNMLSDVNVDVIKLDMKFLQMDPAQVQRGMHVLESIVSMCKTLGIPMVVEGVEKSEQLRVLKSMGCRYAQGHFFNPALTPSVAEILLRDPLKIDYKDLRAKNNEQFSVREFLDEKLFTDSMLNNILGPVAIYCQNGEDLKITRFNEQFYECINDPGMEARQKRVQNSVLPDDIPLLWKLLDEAVENELNGSCRTIRFYKSNGGLFWYRIHMFFLMEEDNSRFFYGQINDVTEELKQSIRFFDILKRETDFCLRLNVTQSKIQMIPETMSLAEADRPHADLFSEVDQKILPLIADPQEREEFRRFIEPSKILEDRQRGIYEAEVEVKMKMESGGIRPIRFHMFCASSMAGEDLYACVFGSVR